MISPCWFAHTQFGPLQCITDLSAHSNGVFLGAKSYPASQWRSLGLTSNSRLPIGQTHFVITSAHTQFGPLQSMKEPSAHLNGVLSGTKSYPVSQWWSLGLTSNSRLPIGQTHSV